MPNQLLEVLLYTIAISGLSRVRTDHRHLGDLLSSSHRQAEVFFAPFRKVTWAASTSKKRNIELPCFMIWPSRRRFPFESSKGTNPKHARSASRTEIAPPFR